MVFARKYLFAQALFFIFPFCIKGHPTLSRRLFTKMPKTFQFIPKRRYSSSPFDQFKPQLHLPYRSIPHRRFFSASSPTLDALEQKRNALREELILESKQRVKKNYEKQNPPFSSPLNVNEIREEKTYARRVKTTMGLFIAAFAGLTTFFENMFSKKKRP